LQCRQKKKTKKGHWDMKEKEVLKWLDYDSNVDRVGQRCEKTRGCEIKRLQGKYEACKRDGDLCEMDWGNWRELVFSNSQVKKSVVYFVFITCLATRNLPK
jgi:hypothetical protein